MRPRGKILVLHFAGDVPLAGVAWQAAHYLVGIARLGYDVYYVEDSGTGTPYDPRKGSVVEDCSYNVAFIERMMKRLGLEDRWVYWDAARDVHHGLSREELFRLYGEADALLNLCGTTRFREEHLRCPVRIYVETDPAYEQIKLAQGDQGSAAFLGAHTHHFTYGENLGAPDCPIPLEKFAWRTTRPPVVLDLWDHAGPSQPERFTTVANWSNAGKDITYRGETYYWSKQANFLRFQDLPRHTPQTLELALGCPPEVRSLMREKGWLVVDSVERSCDLEVYKDYISGSRGEFTVAKDLYARTRCGWFSDRSVCYLAAGRPVVTQDTGFGKFVPTGKGLFAFSTMDEAVEALARINADYVAQCTEARRIAEEFFGAEVVLKRLLAQAGL